ncbi:MAG: hypothetical protein JWP89_1027 [Schlesneria sp.]|nr:hypothetical protein [Schlesneria sp.]
MQDIDFLPADYVCVQTTRKNDTWLRGLFVAVLALMALGWFEQQRSLRELVARRDRAQIQVAAMLSQVDLGDQLRVELQQGEDQARLLHGLRLHASPTRWLTEVVGALPEQVLLTEMHAEIEEGAAAAADSNADDNSSIDPLHQDLQRFVKQTPRRALMISLHGTAADDLQVAEFLRQLHQTRLFERVQLLFTDHQPVSERMQRSFAIRLRTRSLLGAQRTNQPVASGDHGDLRN